MSASSTPRTSAAGATRKPLPYADPRHLEVAQLLVEEAHLFDTQQYEQWLDMLCDDIRYLMPVRVTTARNAGFDSLAGMHHFDEDLYSLRKRVERFATEHAWTEDPPSRLRHYVTNVRTFETDAEAELRVESYVLVFRSRGDVRDAELVSAGRVDVLRREGGRLRLARREVSVDESVLRTQNLAIFL
ncbi:MAG: 3-phenylpropionate/cinnamic acid dioxygenase subunit beta [Carbonactinosporaceae bacterium]